VFNLLKNSVLSHPFDLCSQKNYPLIKKVFSDVLFLQTSYEKLAGVNSLVAGGSEEYKVSSEKNAGEYMKGENAGEVSEGEEELTATDSMYRLEQMAMIAVNNIADVFIYYVATVYAS
jgi:hypothetical protein